MERTLSGRVAVDNASLPLPGDPITTGGGVPIHGARVEVRDASGAAAIAEETQVLPTGSRVARAPASTASRTSR